MIEINGEKGGGQMLRTALTMATVTGKNFCMENIRGNRRDPGLKAQHMECVKACKRLCDAKVEGLEKGSSSLVFKPGKYRNESFTSNIGTAGSVNLLLDSVLPVTSQFNESFRIDVKGGTDVKWSPTSMYFEHVKIPLLESLGLKAGYGVKTTGFYPEGGGEVRLETEDYSMQEFSKTARGGLQRFEVYSKASKDLEESSVAERQASELFKKIKKEFISIDVEKEVSYVESDSTGSAVLLKAVYSDTVAGFDALGEKGKRSEEVAEEAFQDFMKFHGSEGVVDRYMADQLMVFAAIIGGEYTAPEITPHITSNAYVLEAFGAEVSMDRQDSKALLRFR